jgi:hypothetical protein
VPGGRIAKLTGSSPRGISLENRLTPAAIASTWKVLISPAGRSLAIWSTISVERSQAGRSNAAINSPPDLDVIPGRGHSESEANAYA